MMIDAQCKCGKRIGWSGTMRNRPACSRCGFRPPQSDLDAMADKMEADQKLLDTHPGKASAEERRLQRVASGLGLRKAAELLGILPSHLSDTEHCRAEPSPELLDKMAEVYHVGPPLPEKP